MQLSQHEKQQLQDAGFDQAHVEHIEEAKAAATSQGVDWGSLFTKIIQNGPQLYELVKNIVNLFKKPAQ